jgi:hypothetical protein
MPHRHSALHVHLSRPIANDDYPEAAFSNCSIPGGYVIQGRADRVQITLSIFTQLGSSKVPAETPQAPGNLSNFKVTVVPHRGQNCMRIQR